MKLSPTIYLSSRFWLNIMLMALMVNNHATAQIKNTKNQLPQDAGAQISTRLMQVEDKSYKTLGEKFRLAWTSDFNDALRMDPFS